MSDLYVYTYGLDNAAKAVINVLLDRKYGRIDCTGQFQRILTEDSSCVALDPDKLTEEEWDQMDRRFSGELSTLILLTKQPDRQPEFPHYIIWPDRPCSAKRERAMDILRKAQFPCLLPIDRETGKSHVLNDGFVVIDIETSGTDPKIHEIAKLSAVWVADFRVADRFETLVQIKHPMHRDVEKLTGITNEMLKDAPCIKEALQRLVQWHPLDPVVFYRSEFDTAFLHTALVKTGVAFNACRPQIDLMYLTARLYTAYSMEHTLKLYSTVKLLPETSKSDDVLLIAELLIFYLQKLQNEYGFHCVSDLFELYPYEDALYKAMTQTPTQTAPGADEGIGAEIFGKQPLP